MPRAVLPSILCRAVHPQIMEAVSDNGGHDTFYGLLYVGLWHESHMQPDAAKEAIVAAVRTPYAEQSGDYMAALARVHCVRRGWAQLQQA